jgi:hypothetical protein
MRTIRILLSLSLSVLSVSAFAAADLHISSSSPQLFQSFEPGSKVTYIWSLFNVGDTRAELPTLTMQLPPGAQLIGVNTVVPTASCSESNGVVSCTALPVDPQKSGVISFDAFAPTVGGAYSTTASLTWSGNTIARTSSATLNIFRDFNVTSTGDSGPSTLRQTILDTNAVCTDTATCRVHFVFGTPVPTIVPLSQLPVITSTNAIFTTDIPDNTPVTAQRKVLIDGSQLTTGDGLVVTTNGWVRIIGVAVVNFPWNGVVAFGGLGRTDVDLCHVDGSGLRGVAAFSNGIFSVSGSAIRGNRRSGVFIGSADRSSIGGCMITGNGASGVFVGAPHADLELNTIANNGDFGVAIPKSVRLVSLYDNTLRQNGVLGIDRGLDFRSINDPAVPNAPAITDATYDAASNTTVVTLRWDPTPEQVAKFGHIARYFLFDNSTVGGYGKPEAEHYLADQPLPPTNTAVVRVNGDLRGKILTAYVAVYQFGDDAYPEASELSDGTTVH